MGNCQKVSESVRNRQKECQKVSESVRKVSRSGKSCHKVSKKTSKDIKNFQKWSKFVRKESKLIRNGQELSHLGKKKLKNKSISQKFQDLTPPPCFFDTTSKFFCRRWCPKKSSKLVKFKNLFNPN